MHNQIENVIIYKLFSRNILTYSEVCCQEFVLFTRDISLKCMIEEISGNNLDFKGRLQ